MQVVVIGSGYVGLVAGACFASGGFAVTCVDIDAGKVERLRQGIIPIWEPGLEQMVRECAAAGRLHFTTDGSGPISQADAVFIAVGTPPQEDGSADLSHVLNVARSMADHLTGYTAVVVKSTVPIGTCDKVQAILDERLAQRPGVEAEVVSNPEFLKEGAAIEDFVHPDRVVVGARSERARHLMDQLYAPFVRGPEQMIHVDVRSSEMTKYAANAMLATRISFMNEVAALCDKVGANVKAVQRGIGLDARIGALFLNAGIGYGGSCFPKDVKALMSTGRDAGCAMEILSAVESVNDQQKGLLARRVLKRLGEDLRGKTVALLGLAFKPDTDDMREAPSLTIARKLVKVGAKIVGYDPVAQHTARVELGDSITYAASWQEAVASADAVLLVTEWSEFRGLSASDLAGATRCRLVYDGRNIWDPKEFSEAGFEYHGIGRR
ncbi:MAG: UDP-glucose/GDP-mannose dehydrogenase family protein [Deltaproteobacteria bacterium]|nr:UDP-glucose/GDP-mannose dehydrogenase family protein [Deltaproteobacteria bacterium]